MSKNYTFCEKLCSLVLSLILLSLPSIQSWAQSATAPTNRLDAGTQLALRLTEQVSTENMAGSGIINAEVTTDVYSSDGYRVLIKAGTPAFLEFSTEPNGSWGKAGKVSITYAYTKTIDNKQVPLRLSYAKKGDSNLFGVILISALFFPIGLVAGCFKGSMPRIDNGTVIPAHIMQDIMTEPIDK